MPVVDSAGVPIYYENTGEGPPIVLVHGYLSSLEGNWGERVDRVSCRRWPQRGRLGLPRARQERQTA